MTDEMGLADVAGPSGEDLSAIEAEWPVIAAELDLLDAEIRVLCADGVPSVLDVRRWRRAAGRVLAALAVFYYGGVARHRCGPGGLAECRYGCKVVRCQTCGRHLVSHRSAYGCSDSLVAA